MEDLIGKINEIIWGFPIILLLCVTSIFLTIKLKFPQFKIFLSFKDIFNIKREKPEKITSFKSLMTVLAGTLGTGNITGVATAISIGGIGSLFWMFVSGVLVLVISYAENIVVLKYRKKNKNGFYGGAMYVLEDVLDNRTAAYIFSFLVILSSICTGTITQSNSLSTIINSTTRMDEWVVGVILGIITIYIIFGGKTRLANISSVVIPICSILYIMLCLSIIYINSNNLISGLKDVVCAAFGLKKMVGGIVGLSISKTIGKGFSIGMFSNEAGMGTAPMFTATTEDDDIKKEARIASTSVIIDTLILCMLTGITIVSTGKYSISNPSIMLKEVFSEAVFGNFILNICMIFFVISTIPCLEFYGEQGVKYVFKTKLAIYIYRLIFVVGILVGSIMTISVVWDLAGIFNALMTLPNIYMIYKLFGNDKLYNLDKL